MHPPTPHELLDRIRELPAGRPLMAALGQAPAVYLVGGAVRDLLLGGAPGDLDLVVEGDPVPVARSIGPEVVVHDRFGTSSVTAAGFSYDLARARREVYPRPGALPDVEPAPIAEDLRRRDFTINALAVALGGEHPGEVVAFPGAIEDLGQRVLRVLHPASFIDDPTRLFRLARYRGRLGFSIAEETRARASEAVRTGALETLSGPRIGNELRLLATEPDPVSAFLAMRELGLDQALHPGFGLRDEGLARRALALLPADGRADVLILALASLGVPALELRDLLERLAFEAADVRAILAAASRPSELAGALAAAQRPSEIATATAGATPEAVALAGALGAEAPAREWLEHLRDVKLEIDGRDLLAAGVPEGPAVGAALSAALAAKLDGRARDRGAELAAALEAVRGTG
ncbi:MAG TPA: hypothetical protein VKR21_02715 [Solirubrobacteraceae bacterium]|nr:hypothetical protein [Solirubrobacteraceae bacterium]